jgi:hypothetical protein
MRTIGRVTTVVLLAIGAVAAVAGVRSIPDLQRYLRMRQM